MSSKVERQKRKAQLLGQIQQQRLDLSVTRRGWLEATEVYDRGWKTLLSLRDWVLVGSSIMAVRTIRNPSLLVRRAKRDFSVWNIWRLMKSTIRQQQLHGQSFTYPQPQNFWKILTVFLADNSH